MCRHHIASSGFTQWSAIRLVPVAGGGDITVVIVSLLRAGARGD
jgi:hypothetical protein